MPAPRKVDLSVVPKGWWQKLVFPVGRPEETVDRNAYVFCVLEQFHTALKHRDIFAATFTVDTEGRMGLRTYFRQLISPTVTRIPNGGRVSAPRRARS